MNRLDSIFAHAVPVSPHTSIEEVRELLLEAGNERFLCLPVVEGDKPVGIVSRNGLQKIFMRNFGREIYGKRPVSDVMNPTPLTISVDQSMEDASRYITANIRVPVTEDFIVTRDGKYFGMGSVVDLLRGMEQRVAQRNVDLAKAYDRLKSSQSQLVQSEKMASLGQMVAGVAHEINTPLGYVKNNVGLAQEVYSRLQNMVSGYENLLELFGNGCEDRSRIESQLQRINGMREEFDAVFNQDDVTGLFADTLYGIEQISEIVVNLKDFSRLDQAPVENVDLNACLDSALNIARNVIKNKAEIVKDYGKLPRVSCSPSQINQVFLNLLTNAAHAIADRGTIHIRSVADERYAHVFIQDNGKGMPQEILKKIFDPFFTTKPVGEGTGLGLSIAYKIIQDHQGMIRVGSKVGVGTKFCISLPLSSSTPPGAVS